MQHDRILKLEEQVRTLTTKRSACRKDISDQKRRLKAKGEEVRANAAELMAIAERQLAEVESQLAFAESVLEFERAVRRTNDAFDRVKVEQAAALESGGVGSIESDHAAAALLRDLEDVRAGKNFLKDRDADLVERLRPFVAANFKGYTRSDDPEKRYPAWFADAALFIAVLQDNPLYWLTVDQLVKLVGYKAAVEFFEVDYGAVVRRASEGTLVDTSGTPVTLDQLAELRRRKERTPSLVLKARGDQPIEDLLDLIDPRFAARGVDIDALGLDGATSTALRAAGYSLVEQVRASFDALQRIRGIGPKRAAKILDALVARAA